MQQSPIPDASWCAIHRERISRNLELTLGLVPNDVQFCAVMKADAYGHGIDRVVPLLIEQGVTSIGITSNGEARAVRKAGFEGQLIRLRAATPQEMQLAVIDRVEEQIGSRAAALHMRALRETGRGCAGVHLALNAGGMSRDGLEISTEAGRQECLEILNHVGPSVVGICTHFPSNDPAPLKNGSDIFRDHVSWVCENSDLERSHLLVHAGSTLTLLSGASVETDMYRCGAILYGFLRPELGFCPTMELKARVCHLGEYPKGSNVGYDCDAQLDSDRRLACISIGYAAGYNRIAQNRGSVLIAGARAPVLGKVSMNSIVADVTDIPGVQVGDEVVIFGGDGPNAIVPEMALEQFGTIIADLMADWGMRNSRIYV